MTCLRIESDVDVNMQDVLVAVDKLDTPDLENFFEQIATLVVQRKTATSDDREATLLAKIKSSVLAEHIQVEYERLYEKLKEETINEEEYQRLNVLLQQIEQQGVERLKYLIELSKLKDKSLTQMMEELNIDTVTPVLHG
jgi:hypothetical protein